MTHTTSEGQYVVRWRNSLLFRIPVVFLGLLVVLVLAVTTIMSTVGKSLLEEQAYKLLGQVGNTMVSELSERIALTESLTHALANMSVALPADIAQHKKLIPNLIDYKGTSSFIAGGGVWPEPYQFSQEIERRSFFWGRDKNEELKYFDNYNALSGAGYHSEQWYVPVKYLKPGQAFWSRSYMDPYSYQPMVTCSVPMWRDGSFYGVATIDLKLDGLSKFLQQEAAKMGGYAFALDRNGKFLSFPDEELAKTVIFELGDGGKRKEEFIHSHELAAKTEFFQPIAKRLDAINSNMLKLAHQSEKYLPQIAKQMQLDSYQIDAPEAEFIAATFTDPLGKETIQDVQLERFDLPNDLILNEAVTVAIFHMPNTYWKLVTVIPLSHATAGSESIYKTLLFSILAISIVVVASGFFFIRVLLIRPLGNMTQQLQETSEDGTEVLSVPGNNELSALAYWFNLRTNQWVSTLLELSWARDDLEETVCQRTQSLTETNQQLTQQITERKRAEQALLDARQVAEQANHAKSKFLASMSHELRTPLNAILGFAQILGQDSQLASSQKEKIKTILHSGQHLLMLISDILDMSKIEAGHLQLDPRPFELAPFLKNIVFMLQPRAEQKQLRFICRQPQALPMALYGDDTRLRQVLINLLGNAVKFTQEGLVSLEINYQNGSLYCCIEDTGPGIPHNHRETIFQPFKQVGDQSRFTEGTGLGLPISRKLVELMKGDLTLDGRYTRGARFELKVPLAEVNILSCYKNTLDSQAVIGIKGEPCKILVVDDNPPNRAVLSSLLTPLGFDVAEASNGKEGLEKAIVQCPHLILMDLVMPQMDGYEATRRIRHHPTLKNTPIIAISSSVFAHQRHKSLQAGCNDFVEKPFQTQEILAKLKLYLSLEWIYETAEINLASDELKIVVPPEHVMQRLGELVNQGDIQGIIEYASHFIDDNVQYEPFTTRLKHLAKTFQLRQLRSFIQQNSQQQDQLNKQSKTKADDHV